MGKPDIIYEDNDIIICYKPAGIATQTRRIGQQDMESFIRNYRAAKNEPPYVGIVHRLDQPGRGSDGICQESESRGFFKQTDKGAYNREILSCGKQRAGSVGSR